MPILYTIFISSALASGLTFYLTRRHFYRPSAPLPTQTSTGPISVSTESTQALSTVQDDINNLVVALDANTKSKNKPVQSKSWLGMNEGRR